MYLKIMKIRIVGNLKHFVPYNVFFLNKNTKFLKLNEICSRIKSILICKIQSILVPPHFRLVPHHFVCSGDGIDTRLHGRGLNLPHFRNERTYKLACKRKYKIAKV